MLASARSLRLVLISLLVVGCGGGAASSGPTAPAAPRPGGAVDLTTLVPADALVVLHADLDAVRQDPMRYARIASELSTELNLGGDSSRLRELLDRTQSAVGVVGPGAGGQEGLLLFSGLYTATDFEHALGMATSRHGSAVAPQAGADGRQIYSMGTATVAQLDQWTWAVAVGPAMRAHVTQVPLNGGPRFAHNLAEFGLRIGLPRGATQAWADQDQEVGVAMVGLVFAGENPQMVHNFVSTVRAQLGL